jgi:hypothetical protein
MAKRKRPTVKVSFPARAAIQLSIALGNGLEGISLHEGNNITLTVSDGVAAAIEKAFCAAPAPNPLARRKKKKK